MLCHRVFKFEIYPTLEQKEQINKTFSCCREIYSLMFIDKQDYYTKTKTYLKNTPAQYKEKYPHLREVDSLALANVAQDLDDQYSVFWKHNNDMAYFPRHKLRTHDNQYKTSCVNNNIRIEDGCIKLPKIGWVKIYQHYDLPDDYKIVYVIVNRDEIDRYYVRINIKFERWVSWIEEPTNIVKLEPLENGTCVLSNGKIYKFNNDKMHERLRVERFKLSKCKNGSQNWTKQKAKVDKILIGIHNFKRDYLHKVSCEISDTYDGVCVDSKDFTGTHSAYKKLLSLLNYKLQERGKKLIETKDIDTTLKVSI